jgi:copper chaperone
VLHFFQIPPTPIQMEAKISDKLTLRVPGMSCGHCVDSVSSAVGEVSGVNDVNVDLESKRVEVVGDGLELAPVAEAIRDAGYEPEQP